MFLALEKNIKRILKINIEEERKAILEVFIDFIKKKCKENIEINLNFICTHNSRRSQFSQIWAHTAAVFYNIEANCYSGGTEVTTFNEIAVDTIRRSGFEIKIDRKNKNPFYYISYDKDNEDIKCFSKLYDHPINKKDSFAAIMNCSHADENCPLIPGAEIRIPIQYKDPKKFDNTPEEKYRYDECSDQIASELFYVFKTVAGN